ncbi:YitT family protein [Serpentinicella sp. ANB-PHB4]|uniref:YitT family protein n=1 Tax=Serpentinicella sp. ANB-PHB4 TaxID=3074076 RepID=UPI00285921B5|nr:YitT family protein [Serpentinicella sp. ANB-PHB4]MDR5659354.1 YitT family protein [Serpentinicella sp. ANB-PHB4]
MRRKKYNIFIEYLGITFGCALVAFSLNFFLKPHTIAPGGVTGLAIIIEKLSGIPIDITNLAVNIPLFIIGISILGKAFGFKTAYATVVLSGLIRLFIVVFGEGAMITEDLLLATIYGGIFVGSGLGLVFRFGGTTGGTDLSGAILNKYFPSFSIPQLMMFLDLMVVALAGIVDRNVETSLYSVIALYILVKLADFVVQDFNYAKAFYIICDNPQIVGKKILEEMGRGVTSLDGRGLYTGNKRDVLLCVVNRAEVTKLKRVVYEMDEKAFIMVTTIHEVLGEGFKEIKK